MTFRRFVLVSVAFCIPLSYMLDHITIGREWDFKTPESQDGIVVASSDYAKAPHKGPVYRYVTMDGAGITAVDYSGKTIHIVAVHRIVVWRQGDEFRRLFAL